MKICQKPIKEQSAQVRIRKYIDVGKTKYSKEAWFEPHFRYHHQLNISKKIISTVALKTEPYNFSEASI